MRTPSQLLTTERYPGRLHVMVQTRCYRTIRRHPHPRASVLSSGRLTDPGVLACGIGVVDWQVMWAKGFPADDFGYGSPSGYAKLSCFSQQVQYVRACVLRAVCCTVRGV